MTWTAPKSCSSLSIFEMQNILAQNVFPFFYCCGRGFIDILYVGGKGLISHVEATYKKEFTPFLRINLIYNSELFRVLLSDPRHHFLGVKCKDFLRMVLFTESMTLVFKICLTEARSTINYKLSHAKVIMLHLHEGQFEESI